MPVHTLFDKRNKSKSKRKSISKIAKILKSKKSKLDLISTRSENSSKNLIRNFDTFSNNSKDFDLTSNASFQTINSSKTIKSKVSKRSSKKRSKRTSKDSRRSSRVSKRSSKNSRMSKRKSKKPQKNLIKLEPMTTEQYNNYFNESEVKEISVEPKEKKKKKLSKDTNNKLDLTQDFKLSLKNGEENQKFKEVTIVAEEDPDKKTNKPQRIYTEEEILNCMSDTIEVNSIDDLELNDKICYFTTDQDGNKGFRKGGIIQKIYKPFREGDSYKMLIRNKLGLSWCVKWDIMTSCYKHNKNGKISEENKKIREELKKIKKNYKEQSILVASLEETLKSHTKTINYLVSKLG